MIEIVKHNKKAQLIIALALVAILAVSAVCFDWFAWAQPGSQDTAVIADESVPTAMPEIAEETPVKEHTDEEGLILCEADLSEEPEVPEEEPAPVWTGEPDGFLTVGLYSACPSVPDGARTEIDVACKDGFILAKKVERGWVFDTDLSEYTAFTVRIEDSSINLYDDEDLVIAGICSDDVLMSAALEPDDRIITIDRSDYRDGVMFKIESASRMSVINFVEMEHYLWGSINIEMTYSNPEEALKAQAVASRSFAVAHFGYHGKYGFDVCTTSNCQSYKGCSAEREQTVQACKDTAGKVMCYDGEIACGYYFSNSGGYTMNSEDVWGRKVGYLRSVQDGYANFNEWNFSVDFAYIQSKLAENEYYIGDLQSVEVTSQYENGAIRTLTFTGTEGSVSLPGDGLAKYLYADSDHYAKSKIYCIGNSPYPEISFANGSVSRKIYSIGGEVSMDEFYVQTEEGPVQVKEPKGLYVTKAKSIVPLLSSTETTGTTYPILVNEPVTDGVVYVSGYGFGHGVGMSQFSAINMAKAGKTWDEILEYFYTGIHYVNYKSLLQ